MLKIQEGRSTTRDFFFRPVFELRLRVCTRACVCRFRRWIHSPSARRPVWKQSIFRWNEFCYTHGWKRGFLLFVMKIRSFLIDDGRNCRGDELYGSSDFGELFCGPSTCWIFMVLRTREKFRLDDDFYFLFRTSGQWIHSSYVIYNLHFTLSSKIIYENNCNFSNVAKKMYYILHLKWFILTQ